MSDDKPRIHVRDDGTLTIVQFTDLHWQNGEPADIKTRVCMENVLEAERPDLVVISGDLIGGDECRDPAAAIRSLSRPMEQRAIPWAAVLGNHDQEASYTRKQMMEAQLEHPHCLSQLGPDEVSGWGNYVLHVHGADGSEARVWNLYFLDSNAYAETSVNGYGWIRHDQIRWYLDRAAALEAEQGGTQLPALAFFHIPLPEYSKV